MNAIVIVTVIVLLLNVIVIIYPRPGCVNSLNYTLVDITLLLLCSHIHKTFTSYCLVPKTTNHYIAIRQTIACNLKYLNQHSVAFHIGIIIITINSS